MLKICTSENLSSESLSPKILSPPVGSLSLRVLLNQVWPRQGDLNRTAQARRLGKPD